MRMWLLSQAPQSLSPHDHGPPSPTATTTVGTAARTAPLSPTQYVTNDCARARFSTTDATDAFWICCVVRRLRAFHHAAQIRGSRRIPGRTSCDTWLGNLTPSSVSCVGNPLQRARALRRPDESTERDHPRLRAVPLRGHQGHN